MSKWSPFKFVSNKKYKRGATIDDYDNFNNYMVCRICSFDEKLIPAMRWLNTKAFNHFLPPKIQCMAYNFLDGYDVKYKMVNPPKKTTYDRETLYKIMDVMECSLKKAEEHIEDGFINIDDVIEYFEMKNQIKKLK